MRNEALSTHSDFLRQHAPFNRMAAAHVDYLAKRLQVGFYAKGEIVAGPNNGPARRFYIIKQGRLRGETPGGEVRSSVWELVTGECFPIGALLSHRPVRTVHRAVEDTFCLELDRVEFDKLLGQSPVFQDFCSRRIANLLDQALQESRAAQGGGADGADLSLNTPLEAIMRRPVLSCAPDTPLRQALERMNAQRAGSIVIIDSQECPLGILTTVDVLARIALPEVSLETPIRTVMTPDPKVLPPRAFAYDAALLMAEHGIRHVCVVDHGRLQGIVSERDLFHLQRIGLGNLSQAIRHAADLPTLKRLSHQIVQLTDQMLAQGAAVDPLVQIITTLNDHLTRRVITLCEEEHGRPEVAYTWLSFGSEGRQEQTLKTDQDNGMLFHADRGSAEHTRSQLLPLAERINQALADIGFPLCPGNIMASNPECCLSLEEWRQRFARWIDSATPENLLKATIFFDFRPLLGDAEPVEQLRGWLLDTTRKNGLFRRMLAENALRNRPPLGLLGDFKVTRGGEHPRTLDLKVQGVTPFVDAARIIALTHRISDTNTLGRLRSAAQGNALKFADVAAWSEAYQYIQLLRMRTHRDQAQRGEPLDNHIDPSTLNELEQRILKEGFRQARKLQFKLSMEYQI